MSRAVQVITVLTTLGCGLSAGVFFAFSSFVMPALDRLPPAQGVAAMQQLNKTAVGPLFMTALFGSALAAAGLAVWAVTQWGEPAAPWVIAGAVLYVVGAVLVTGGANVPLNDSLAPLDPGSAQAAAKWADYVPAWSLWNHLRTLLCLGGTAALIVALLV